MRKNSLKWQKSKIKIEFFYLFTHSRQSRFPSPKDLRHARHHYHQNYPHRRTYVSNNL